MRRSFGRTLTAVFALLVMLVQGTWVLAGTTGGIGGTVSDAQTGRTIAGAKVSVSSPSQSVTATTDAQGRYSFVSLAPDTYTLTISAPGYQAFSQAGITVVADQTQNYNFSPTKALAQIGRITARSASDLVKPGQTADVYSINGQASQNAQALGGGGNLFQTYAALASVPGVYVPQGTTTGQNSAAPYIRGGDYNQVGFEFDGIPVNRAFDNYASNTQGITGQQELQVYTGGVPASSAGEGLSGYVNQVIKTGTYPGTSDIEGVIGSPSFYHYLRGEYGGATPDRNFSYYVGATGWNQTYRYGNQFNGGSGIGNLGVLPFATAPGTGSIANAPFDAGSTSNVSDRETVANLHFGIPHKNGDGGRDDIQILGSIGRQYQQVYDSFNDYGGINSPLLSSYLYGAGAAGPYPYPKSTVYTGPIFNGFNPGMIQPYYYPNSPNTQVIDPNQRGMMDNNNAVFKVQYQKNIGSSAYIRAYAYSNYSTWAMNDPSALYVPFTTVGALDYELDTHTRGAAIEFADQLNTHNLLTGSASYTFANVLRDNNNTMIGNGYQVELMGGNGVCYNPVNGAAANCYNPASAQNFYGGYTAAGSAANNPNTVAYNGSLPYSGSLLPITGQALANGAQYQVVSNGYVQTMNTVTPKFGSFSLSDQMSIGNKLKLDIGARFNSYIYGLADTSQQAVTGGSNALLFSNYNMEHCFNATPPAGQPQFVVATVASGYSCPTGYAHTNLSNTYPGNVTSYVFEPRLSGTYTLSPYDVIRFSAGKYSQPTTSASVQYNEAGNLAAYTASNFLEYGFNTPAHDLGPQISYNYDFTYEKQLKKAPLSFSFTPFYRHTENQSQSFYLDPRTNFVSSLNVGSLRAFGYEFMSRYGDFNRDGLSAQVSFAYTNSKIRYNDFPGSSNNMINLIDSELIGGYNKLTSAGGGSPCYATGGVGTALVNGACGAGTLANPYYNMPMQKGLDPSAYYSPYDVVPAAAGGLFAVGSSNSYEVPYTLTAVVQYKKKGWRIVPTAQWDSGFRYGSPFAWTGYDPSNPDCVAQVNAGAGTAGCVANGDTIFRPNPYTGMYDGLGTFMSPSTLTLSAQISKELSKRVTVTAILANLYRHCFSHGYAWEQGGSQACTYGVNGDYAYGYAFLGNGTKPGTSAIQNDPFGYAPGGYGIPFNAYLSVSVKM